MNDSGEIPREGLELPPLNSSRELNAQADDIEANRESTNGAPSQLRPKLLPVDPKKLLEPIRTDPVQALEARKRRLDRVADSSLPEIHYIGQISSAKEIIYDVTEGAFCRYRTGSASYIVSIIRRYKVSATSLLTDGKSIMAKYGSI